MRPVGMGFRNLLSNISAGKKTLSLLVEVEYFNINNRRAHG